MMAGDWNRKAGSRMRFERREHRPLALVVATPLLAVVAALAISGVLIAIAGAPVFEAYWRILVGAFGSRLSATETLTRAAPLMLTGLAAAVAFRARLWNIGAEGQFYLGAIAVAAASSQMLGGLPAAIQIPLLLIIGAVAGMVLLLIPLWLRLRFSVDEVVTTLLLNFVAVLFVSMLIDTVLKDPMAFGWPQSQSVADDAMLPKLLARSRLHIGIIIAIVIAIVLHWVQSRTVFGIQSRPPASTRLAPPLPACRWVQPLSRLPAFRAALPVLQAPSRSWACRAMSRRHTLARIWLSGHRRGDARQSPSPGRRSGGSFHCHHVRRRRWHEPQHGNSHLYRRCDGGSVAAQHADCLVLHAIQDPPMSAVFDILASAGLWAAVLRIATPADPGHTRCLAVRAFWRAQSRDRRHHDVRGHDRLAQRLQWCRSLDRPVHRRTIRWCLRFLHAGLTVTLGLSQHVSGLGVTLFASSFSYYVFRLLVPVAGTPPTITPFAPIDIPGLSSLPFIGPAFFTQTPPTYLAIIMAIVLGYIIFRTPLGLAIRVTGENPHAAEARASIR